MKTIVLPVLALSFSTSAFADVSVPEYKMLAVPADGVLAAAQRIKPQTGPFYSVSGTLRCTYKRGIHGTRSKLCEVNIAESEIVSSIEKPDAVFDALVKIKSELAQFNGFFEAPFYAQKINSETPPYSVSSMAEVYLSVVFPGDTILKAVQKIVPKTSPGYVVSGVLACTESLERIPPIGDFLHNQNCSVQVNGKTEKVEDAYEILNLLHETHPFKLENWYGKQWSFSNNFTASSISRDFPPYITEQEVNVQLYR